MSVDGVLYHKKCPKTSKSSEQEKQDLKELRDAINDYILRDKDKNPSPNIREKGFNWARITKNIKYLKENGYSYKDQLYALHKVVGNGIFMGYQPVVNYIHAIIKQRDADKGAADRIKSVTNEVNYDFDVPVDEIDW